MKDFISWMKNVPLNESDTRYSVEVNFRTKLDEVLKNAAKITLGYVSAGLKREDFHVKQVLDEVPMRILISARNWDDGEWVCVASWNPHHKTYVLSKGFYNKDRKTVSIQDSSICKAENASELVSEIKNIMYQLKDMPDRKKEKLKKVPLKRGPK
jgi:hypothetical protein